MKSFMLEKDEAKGTVLSKLTHGLNVKLKINEPRSKNGTVFYEVESDKFNYSVLMDRVVALYN